MHKNNSMGYILKVFIATYMILVDVLRSEKILLWPFPYYSHIKELTHIGKGLIEAGHEIHLILPPTLPQIKEFREESSMQLIEYQVQEKDFHVLMKESDANVDEIVESMFTLTPIEDFRINTEGFTQFCTNPLEDPELFRRIKREKYDLALIDGFIVSRCYYIVMYRLRIPYVSISTQYEPWLYRTPALPSFVPFPLHSPPLTPKMTFWERLINAYTLLDWTAYPGIPYLKDELVAKYAPDMPFVTLNWLAGRSLLWLFDTDIAIDFPRPVMPNEVNIGGLTTRPAKTLPGDLKSFMDKAPNGVILASFGSFSALPKKYLDIFLDAFSKIEQRVIFRYVAAIPDNVPEHIKLLKWIPQNDILGHPNTKLFITHCGANSQFEALYHGVPMLNVPAFADQPYNAIRADYKGYSKTMSFLNLTSDVVVASIKEIISDKTYAENINHGSRIFKERPMNPRQRAIYWIEHVLKFGGKHLHSYALDMVWYEYLMLDILAFVIVCCILAICLTGLLFKLATRVMCRNQKLKQQ